MDAARKRLDALAEALGRAHLEGAIVQSAVNLYYYAGTIVQGFLYIGSDGSAALLVRKGFGRAEEESPLEDKAPLASPKALRDALLSRGMATRGPLGLELDVVSAAAFERTRRMFGGISFQDVGGLVRSLRAVKGPEELDEIRRSGVLWEEIQREIPKAWRPGMDEMALSVAMEMKARRSGHQGFIRTHAPDFEMHIGHVLSGPHGASPTANNGPTGGRGLYPAMPHGAGHRTIDPGDPIVVDVAACQRGYVYDGTRTFAVGALPEALQRAFEVARAIWEETPRHLAAGSAFGEAHSAALKRAEAAGLSDVFMGPPGDRVPYLGHGVGLELDELPVISERSRGVLSPGMVVAIEPKFVFPGLGAVGIEDTFEVREEGAVRLNGLAPDLVRL